MDIGFLRTFFDSNKKDLEQYFHITNVGEATIVSPDLVTVAGKELPVSRKYKESVKALVAYKNP